MKKILFALLFVSLMSTSAFALQTTFFGYDPGYMVKTNSDIARNAFFANLEGVGTETFESYSTGTEFPLAINFGVAGTATLTGLGEVATGANSVGRWPISGENYLEVPGSSSSLFSIVFSDPVAAFGFYGTDIGDFDGQVTVTTLSGSSTTYVIPHATGQTNNARTAIYWAVIDTVNPFTSITFANTGSGSDYFGFDDFSIGSIEQVVPAVPEPMTMVLLGLGLVGLAGVRRKIQK